MMKSIKNAISKIFYYTNKNIIVATDFMSPPPYLPEPEENIFVNYCSLLSINDKKTALTFQPVDGFIDYLENYLNLKYKADNHLIVPYRQDQIPKGSVSKALLIEMNNKKSFFKNTMFFNLAYTTTTEMLLAEIGAPSINSAKLYEDLNNKENLKISAYEGINGNDLPRIILPNDKKSSIKIIKLFLKRHGSVWIKSSRGDGGKLVRNINNKKHILDTYEELISKIKEYQEQFKEMIEGIERFKIILEADVSNYLNNNKEENLEIFNINIQYLILENNIEEIGYSNQIHDNLNQYCGNIIDNKNKKSKEFLDFLEISRKSALSHAKIVQGTGYRNFIGYDVVGTKKKSYIIDENCRINGSTIQLMYCRELEKKYSISESISFKKYITYHEFIHCVGKLNFVNIRRKIFSGIIIEAMKPDFTHDIEVGSFVKAKSARIFILGDNIEDINHYKRIIENIF